MLAHAQRATAHRSALSVFLLDRYEDQPAINPSNREGLLSQTDCYIQNCLDRQRAGEGEARMLPRMLRQVRWLSGLRGAPWSSRSADSTSDGGSLRTLWHTVEWCAQLYSCYTSEPVCIALTSPVNCWPQRPALFPCMQSFSPPIALLLSPQMLLLLLLQVLDAGRLACAALPMPYCCNNTRCVRLEGVSEAAAVKGGKCGACRVAQYCGVGCQREGRADHKGTCNRLKEAPGAAKACLAGA